MKITLDDKVLMIDSEIVIDARPETRENSSSSWDDKREAAAKMQEIWTCVREAYMKHGDYEAALMEKVASLFGLKTEGAEVEIVGGPPGHWREVKESGHKFRHRF